VCYSSLLIKVSNVFYDEQSFLCIELGFRVNSYPKRIVAYESNYIIILSRFMIARLQLAVLPNLEYIFEGNRS